MEQVLLRSHRCRPALVAARPAYPTSRPKQKAWALHVSGTLDAGMRSIPRESDHRTICTAGRFPRWQQADGPAPRQLFTRLSQKVSHIPPRKRSTGCAPTMPASPTWHGATKARVRTYAPPTAPSARFVRPMPILTRPLRARLSRPGAPRTQLAGRRRASAPPSPRRPPRDAPDIFQHRKAVTSAARR